MKRLFLTISAALCLAFPASTALAEAPATTAPTEPAFRLDVNEAIGQIGSGMDQALTKLGALAVEYGTKAIELASAVVQAQSIANLAVGFVYLTLGLFAIGWARKKPSEALDWCEPNFTHLIYLARLIIGWGGGLWFVLSGGNFLLNIWNWIGAIYPKLALARMIFDKVAG